LSEARAGTPSRPCGRRCSSCAPWRRSLCPSAAAANDDEDGGGRQDGERTSVSVGVLPIADVAPLHLGIEKGFFDEEGLDVEPQVIQGGAAVVTGVVSGDLALGFAATEPLIHAKARGLPVQIVATGNQAAADPDEAWAGLMVREGGGVRSPQDLEGRTIAVNAVRGTAQLTILAVLERDGVDVSTLDFVEVPFPDMPAALTEGRVPAVAAVEPFVTAIDQRGGQNLVPYFSGLEPGMTIGTYFTLERTIDQDRETVAAFQRAMNRSLEYARAHEEEARDVMVPRVDMSVLNEFPDYRDFRSRTRDDREPDEGAPTLMGEPQADNATTTPEEAVETAFEQLNASLGQTLLRQLLDSSPEFFEQVVVDVLVAMGYGGSRREAGERLGQTGDMGIDGVIREDVLGLDAIYLQAKRWDPERPIGRPDVQAFVGAMQGARAAKGVFITTSRTAIPWPANRLSRALSCTIHPAAVSWRSAYRDVAEHGGRDPRRHGSGDVAVVSGRSR
jgi:NitT/TauT family transport system substrate-binding protein